MPFTAAELPKFTTHPANFIPTVFGGHVLVYESRSHPGRRREFAFKTRFTNQSGVSSCYYRCMSCRSMKNKVPPGPDGKPPQIPCIAVKNGFIVNDPDFPEANDHFCIPPTIEESKQREANGFAKAVVKSRPRQRPRATKPVFKPGSFLSQMKTLQEMTYAWKSREDNNLFDVNTDFAFLNASTSTSSGGVNGVVTDKIQTIGLIESDNNGKQRIEIKVEDDDSDGIVKANSLLASLVNSEPTLRTDITVSQNFISVVGSKNNCEISPCDSEAYQTSPDSYNTLILNSVEPVDSNPLPVSTEPSVITNSRKRRTTSTFEDFLDETVDRYITNSWDLPDNDNLDISTRVAELTCCMILSLAKNVVHADISIKKGKWEEKQFCGEEVSGKTLAIIGLGRIGMEVSSRMQKFGMKIIGYDPRLEPKVVAKNGIQWLPLEKLWPLADYITVHVPLIPQTKDLISAETLKLCKKGVKIINVARTGIINEANLLESLNEEHVGGAAIDVFQQESSAFRKLIEHPKIICTPHFGTDTAEVQQRVIREVYRLSFEVISSRELILLVRAIGTLTKIASILSVSTNVAHVKYPLAQSLRERDKVEKALRVAAIVGIFYSKGVRKFNHINTVLDATKEKLQVTVEPQKEDVITVIAGDYSVSGYATQQGTFITAFNSSTVPIALLAVGILAVNLKENIPIGEINESAKSKLCMEFGMLGGGRVALFSSLDAEEIEDIGRKCSIINLL